jgi:hypothetical protein
LVALLLGAAMACGRKESTDEMNAVEQGGFVSFRSPVKDSSGTIKGQCDAAG